MDYSTFRFRLQRDHVKQATISRITGYSTSAVSEWLNKGKPMPADAVAAIAQSIRMTPEEICRELLGLKPRKAQITAEDAINALRGVLES